VPNSRQSPDRSGLGCIELFDVLHSTVYGLRAAVVDACHCISGEVPNQVVFYQFGRVKFLFATAFYHATICWIMGHNWSITIIITIR